MNNELTIREILKQLFEYSDLDETYEYAKQHNQKGALRIFEKIKENSDELSFEIFPFEFIIVWKYASIGCSKKQSVSDAKFDSVLAEILEKLFHCNMPIFISKGAYQLIKKHLVDPEVILYYEMKNN